MFLLERPKNWKPLLFSLPIAFSMPTIVAAYGEPTEMHSPSEETGKEALIVDMETTAPDSEEVIGTVRISQRATGVVIKPALKGLEPGLHGLHLHEDNSCKSGRSQNGETESPSREPAKEAGAIWDPGFKGNHEGPWGHGHRGALPNLYVDSNGRATTPVYAPRVSSRDFKDRALVLHAERDTYSGEPDSSGGSGDAVACGVGRD